MDFLVANARFSSETTWLRVAKTNSGDAALAVSRDGSELEYKEDFYTFAQRESEPIFTVKGIFSYCEIRVQLVLRR